MSSFLSILEDGIVFLDDFANVLTIWDINLPKHDLPEYLQEESDWRVQREQWHDPGNQQITSFGWTLKGFVEVAISANGKTIVSVKYEDSIGECCDVNIWDAETGACKCSWVAQKEGVYGVAISEDGKTVVTGGFCHQDFEGTLCIWNVVPFMSGELQHRFSGDHALGYSPPVSISSDGKTIGWISKDQTVQIYNI